MTGSSICTFSPFSIAGLCQRDDLVIERALESVILFHAAIHANALVRFHRRREYRRQVDAFHFPVINRDICFQHVDATDHFVHCTETKLRHNFAHIFCHHEQVVHDVLGLAGKFLAQLRILRRDTDRAGIEMTLAHHDAAQGDQRRGREAEFFGTQYRRNRDVATGFELAVGLHYDARTQVIHHQCLVGFGQTQFPRQAGVFDRGQR